MKIAVINGSMRHGSTWHCAEAVVRALGKTGETEVAEFFLPGDMPHFCCGCFSCIYDGADKCPHYGSVRPIVDAIIASDLVILSSPVYGFDVSGQMKALLDHLCYMWMSHRPESAMFRKVGLAVSTAAGAGLRHTLKTMRYSLTYWGMKRVFTFGAPVAAKSWSKFPGRRGLKSKKERAGWLRASQNRRVISKNCRILCSGASSSESWPVCRGKTTGIKPTGITGRQTAGWTAEGRSESTPGSHRAFTLILSAAASSSGRITRGGKAPPPWQETAVRASRM